MFSSIPTVSIILPTFNESPDTIDGCIRSISSQLFEDFECLVLDDSTDASSRARWDHWQRTESRIVVLRGESRRGLVGSINAGVRYARGVYIARVDTDDPCEPDRLLKQVSYLEANPEVDVVGGSLIVVDSNNDELGRRHYPIKHDEIVRRMQWTTAVAHPTVLMRRSAFQRFGFYDESFRYAEDLELWLRWIQHGARFANLPDYLIRCTVVDGGRPRQHWKFNVKARLLHLCMSYCVLQLFGIFCAGLAFGVPPGLFVRAQQLVQIKKQLRTHGS